MVNVVEMAFESFLDLFLVWPTYCFWHVLQLMLLLHVLFGRVSFASDMTCDLTRFVQFGTISALHFRYAPSVVVAGPQSVGISWLLWDLSMD